MGTQDNKPQQPTPTPQNDQRAPGAAQNQPGKQQQPNDEEE